MRWDLRLPGGFEYLRRSIHVKYVSHDYFSVLGIPMRRGRSFQPDENGRASAAVVSEDFVRLFGQGRDLLGGEVRSPTLSYVIVGVAGDVRTTWLTQPARPTVYLPIDSEVSTSLTVVARAARPAPVIPAIRDAVRRVNPDGPAVTVEPLDTIVWRSEERRRFYLVLVSLFAALSGVVAAVGIYGVVARSTALRAVPALRIVLCASVAYVMATGRPVEAQEPARIVQITLDNDFLNFWEPPRERADHHYTHGMRLTWDLARAPSSRAGWSADPGTSTAIPTSLV